MNNILLDTGFLVALNYPHDQKHPQAVQFATTSTTPLLIPEVVLPEVTFLLRRAGGIPAVRGFLNRIVVTGAPLLSVTHQDIQRAEEIMGEYADARFDFVDTCLMALAERLNITHICTFDRRDFSMFRPRHCEYLHLLPN